jgi:hypothetical protein
MRANGVVCFGAAFTNINATPAATSITALQTSAGIYYVHSQDTDEVKHAS